MQMGLKPRGIGGGESEPETLRTRGQLLCSPPTTGPTTVACRVSHPGMALAVPPCVFAHWSKRLVLAMSGLPSAYTANLVASLPPAVNFKEVLEEVVMLPPGTLHPNPHTQHPARTGEH